MEIWEKLLEKDKKKYLDRWLKSISEEETDFSLRQHIIKHSKEIFEGNDNEWLASMKNLIKIFEEKYKIREDVDLQLGRLSNKYSKNPKLYTDQPKIDDLDK